MLLEKMGDGAFSNVYRARDTEGQYGQVAIKVVRKYEMNNMQVCSFLYCSYRSFWLPSAFQFVISANLTTHFLS